MALFDVYLRLRPNSAIDCERFLNVEHTEPRNAAASPAPTHITVKPPTNDHRKRAIEKFAFTRVFEEYAGQREVFESTGTVELIEGVLGGKGREGRDGLVATLGVTGSGKSHTILGSKSQRGITQLTLDALFRHTSSQLVDIDRNETAFESLCAADVSEAELLPAAPFLDKLYADNCGPSRGVTPARGATPARCATPGMEASIFSPPGSRRHAPRISLLPSYPPIDDINIPVDTTAEYAIVVAMYEVHNDRVFDLLGPSVATKMQGQQKRQPRLFKSTEKSPDRKVVAGLKKVICSDLEEALLVLETGLQERRVAGTGSNAASSRSHGFFCIEVKKRHRGPFPGPWTSSTLTVVDLAGSERARVAKTAGATLAEAGKINESLMYLGQCMQMQLDQATSNLSTTPNLVPFRQCKLTELLFSNSFALQHGGSKPPQKAIMIVTADPLGDFNATSQILRYSALAREVTVPRIPSTSSTILSGALTRANSRPATPSAIADELDNALAEIARLRGDLEIAQVELNEERNRRQQAEASWQVAENRIDEVEMEIREEMWSEMEAKLLQEQRRWRAARDAELDAQDDHVDRKLEILARGISIYEDEDKENENGDFHKTPRKERDGSQGDHVTFMRNEDEENRLAELEADNWSLRERIALLEREKEVQRSPSKKMRILKTRRWEGSGLGVEEV